MAQQAWIETVTKGPNQRVRRTVAYRVKTRTGEIARFDVDANCPEIARDSAQKFLAELDQR